MRSSRQGWSDALGRAKTATSALALGAIFALQGPAADLLAIGAAEAKTPGKTYCFYGHCHRVRTIEETRKAIGVQHTIKASYYDDPKKDRYNPSNVTSSGEYFRSDKPDNAASPIWPDGTRMLLWNPSNKRTAVVRINNAGPYWGPRQLDVSRATAEKLGFVKSGVATLHTRVVAAPTPAEATYRKGRQYAPVPGFMGVFESVDTALLEVGKSIYNIFSSPVHAVAGRDAPSEAAKQVRVAEAKVEAKPARPAKPEPKPAEHAAEAKVAKAEPKAARPLPSAAEAKIALAEPVPAAKVEPAAENHPALALVSAEAKQAEAEIEAMSSKLAAKSAPKPEPKPEPKPVKTAAPKPASKPAVKVAKAEPKPAAKPAPAAAARQVAQAQPQPKPVRIATTRVASNDVRSAPQARSTVGPQPQDVESLRQFGRLPAGRAAIVDDDDDERPVRRRVARYRSAAD